MGTGRSPAPDTGPSELCQAESRFVLTRVCQSCSITSSPQFRLREPTAVSSPAGPWVAGGCGGVGSARASPPFPAPGAPARSWGQITGAGQSRPASRGASGRACRAHLQGRPPAHEVGQGSPSTNTRGPGRGGEPARGREELRTPPRVPPSPRGARRNTGHTKEQTLPATRLPGGLGKLF